MLEGENEFLFLCHFFTVGCGQQNRLVRFFVNSFMNDIIDSRCSAIIILNYTVSTLRWQSNISAFIWLFWFTNTSETGEAWHLTVDHCIQHDFTIQLSNSVSIINQTENKESMIIQA